MHPDVLNFIQFLQDVDQQGGTVLNLIIAKIGAVQSAYELCSIQHKHSYYERIQQFSDLFAHIYYNRPLKDFADFSPDDLDSER